MKKIIYLIAFIGIIPIFIAGCANNEEQYIDVEERVGDDDHFKEFKQITSNKQVQKVHKILDEIDWEIAKVNMVRPSDYRFIFQYKNPEIEAKAVLFELWISPNKDKVEIVIEAQSKYIQLNKTQSAELYEILTGRKLSDLQ